MKRNLIALGVLVVLAVAAVVVFTPPSEDEKDAVREVLTEVDADLLDRIEVVRHEGSGDTLREEHIALVRSDDEWRMAEPVDYAVNPTSVERMVDALAELSVIDLIAQNAEKHHVLQVDDELGVEGKALAGEKTLAGEKALAGEKTLAHFIVGVTRNNMTYIRLPGGDAVYRIRGSHRPTFNKSAKNLRDKKVVKLDRGSVSKATFVNENGELTIEREGEGDEATYRPVGVEIENFDERKAASTFRALASLSARDFVDEPLPDEQTGLGPDAAEVRYRAERDGETSPSGWAPPRRTTARRT